MSTSKQVKCFIRILKMAFNRSEMFKMAHKIAKSNLISKVYNTYKERLSYALKVAYAVELMRSKLNTRITEGTDLNLVRSELFAAVKEIGLQYGVKKVADFEGSVHVKFSVKKNAKQSLFLKACFWLIQFTKFNDFDWNDVHGDLNSCPLYIYDQSCITLKTRTPF